MSDEGLVARLYDGKQRFLALVADLRPELHRYCARMTGSVTDGEDIVQDALATAYYALSEMESVPNLRPWLFAIAHRRAIDHLRRYERRHGRPFDDEDTMANDEPSAEDRIAAQEAARVAIGRFCELPPAQRSVVVLKDVLGHSLEEISASMGLGLPAVKSALHRGRDRLRTLGPAPEAPQREPPSGTVAQYVQLFNARDWDGVRALLADEVRLDLVARARKNGRVEVGGYLSRYDSNDDWHFVQGTVEGRDAILVFTSGNDARPSYFIELTVANGRVETIKDFRYVPYITDEAVYSR